MPNSPKEVRKLIRDRKRQHDIAAALGAEIVPPCDLTSRERMFVEIVPKSLALSEAEEAVAMPDSYGQPGQGASPGLGEGRMGAGDGDGPAKPAPKVKKRRLGRFFDNTAGTVHYFEGCWKVRLEVPKPEGDGWVILDQTGPSVHECFEKLWDQWQAYQAGQSEPT